MPDDGSDPEQPRGPFKAFADPKWREKLFSRVTKAEKGTNKTTKKDIQSQNDVEDFLEGRNSTPGRLANVYPESIPRKPVITIIATGGSPGNVVSSPSVPQPSWTNPPKLRQKSRKGLHVSFTSAEPEIIGEGGDEAELPSSEVSKAWISTAEVPLLQSRCSPVSSSETDSIAQLDQEESNVYDPLHPSTQRGSTLQKRKPINYSSSERPVLENSFITVPTSVAPVRSEVLAKSEYDKNPHTLLPLLDSKKSPEYAEDELWKRKAGLEVKPVKQENDVHLMPSKVMGNEARSPDSQNSISQSRLISPKEYAIAGKKDTAQHIIPATPNHPTHAYMELISPYPDHQQYNSSPQSQKEHLSSPPDIESNDVFQDDFYTRVQYLHTVFRLVAEKSDHGAAYSLSDWVRACVWWFLKGRSGIEIASRNEVPSASESNMHSELKQAYVNLAKAWWIAREIISVHTSQEYTSRKAMPSITSSNHGKSEHAQLQTEYDSIIANMQALTIFMKKNRLLPPQSLLIQGTDTSIWIQYPKLAPGLAYLITVPSPTVLTEQSQSVSNLSHTIPLADTEHYFSYGRMFAEAEVLSEYHISAGLLFPCILSIIRKRTDLRVETTIISQDGQVNLRIQSDKQKGPTWANVQWEIKSRRIRIGLDRDFELAVRLGEREFKSLWKIYDYAHRVEVDWNAQENENAIFEDVAKMVQHINHSEEPGIFPSFPVKQCKVRLLSRTLKVSEGTGNRKLYQGHRLVILTPPDIKTLSSMNRVLGQDGPLLFSRLRGEDNAPALLLSTNDGNKKTAIVITFHEISTREVVHALLNGTFVGQDEIASEKIMLQDFSVFSQSSELSSSHPYLSLGQGLQWQHIQIVKEAGHLETGKTVLSEHLRVCINCNYGTIVDRINLGEKESLIFLTLVELSACLGTGELQIGLSLIESTTVRLYRPAQNNLTVSFAKNLLPADATEVISRTLDSVSTAPSSRAYSFNSLPGM